MSTSEECNLIRGTRSEIFQQYDRARNVNVGLSITGLSIDETRVRVDGRERVEQVRIDDVRGYFSRRGYRREGSERDIGRREKTVEHSVRDGVQFW